MKNKILLSIFILLFILCIHNFVFADNLTGNGYDLIKNYINNSPLDDYMIFNNSYFCIFDNISTMFYCSPSSNTQLFIRCDNSSQLAYIYHLNYNNNQIVSDRYWLFQ